MAYALYLDGMNGTYDKFKAKYPALPKIVPEDKISFKRKNGKIVDCRLEKTKFLKAWGEYVPGNQDRRSIHYEIQSFWTEETF